MTRGMLGTGAGTGVRPGQGVHLGLGDHHGAGVPVGAGVHLGDPDGVADHVLRWQISVLTETDLLVLVPDGQAILVLVEIWHIEDPDIPEIL